MLLLKSLIVVKQQTKILLEDKMNTYERLLNVFSAVFENELDTSNITPNSNLREDIKINSIGVLYMALAIEEEFNIKFSNEDFPKIATVADVIDVIEQKLK